MTSYLTLIILYTNIRLAETNDFTYNTHGMCMPTSVAGAPKKVAPKEFCYFFQNIADIKFYTIVIPIQLFANLESFNTFIRRNGKITLLLVVAI